MKAVLHPAIYKIRKGLSLKPFLSFLGSLVKQPLIQLRNFVNMANGFEVTELISAGEGLSGKNKAKNNVVQGEQLSNRFKIRRSL